ncbi:SNF5-domain-containing protein [Sodiomyces alkalinus F11]|uniref:SNF5-domain-containing protein n=1 Tax=Sodiomyces alkalinus (strain CBS 110278 / VKM F-3762 / F11) TaxID=1314773 RepID=A0A3N2PN09_SODAK|nr:SNF5-domain-containing protein [Sodiomyces alkalinus F11]ROT35907.1 SNF5-domain-containing protein [Sodiomyces alkalinus F11]
MAAQPSASASGSAPNFSTESANNGATAASSSDPGSGADPATTAGAGTAAAPNDRDDDSDPQSKPLPVRSKESFQTILLERYMMRDFENQAAIEDAQSRMADTMAYLNAKIDDYNVIRHSHRHFFPPSVLYGDGYRACSNSFIPIDPRMKPPGPQIVYPQQKPRAGKRRSPRLTWKKKDMKKQADQHEELVPVRIDVDWDKIRLRDTFTWNLHDRIVHPEIFAQNFLEDMGLDPTDKALLEPVLHQMHDQLMDFYPFVYSDEDALDPELPYWAYKNDEMRMLVKLNITIGQHTLVDQFEWDINNPLNSPEEFATSMSRELSLSGEFTTAIAHCIREQTQLFTKSLYSVGHPFDGRPLEDPDLINAFLPSPLPSVFRPQQQAKEYAPYLYELSDADAERNEMVFSREQRRQKRSINRRGGPQLPDLKDRQRTIRALIVSSVLPGAATDIEETSLYKRVAAPPGTRRRPGARDGIISDSDESDDSGPDSPAVSQLGGTARTRGLRGAATAAQHRMANLGRSETPEASIIHHHETRRNVGRFGRELRDETEEPTQMIVTLKINKEKLRRFLQNPRARISTSGSQTPSTPAHSRIPSTSAGSNSMPRTASNGQQKTSTPVTQSLLGAVPAPAQGDGQQIPSPPQWLSASLQQLREKYPHDLFEGIMKHSCINPETEAPVPVPQGQAPPPGHKWMFLPRIRCKDCPGKSYTPGPEMTTGNFERHLNLATHRKNVDTRLGFDTRPKAAKPAAENSATS